MSPKRIYGSSFSVLVNPNKQYTLIARGEPIPAGWKPTSKEGTKEQCIKYIEEVWTDMTPRDMERLLKK
jgi:MbtH protein